MTATTSTTPPPPGQAQPAAASFDAAAWEQNDASFLKPSIPLPKAPRAWERAPHSPFARNGKYRKVWKRHETRSKTKAAVTQEKGQKSPAKSPKKVVKKRALESKMEANATPGRTRPKNKAFAATRFERRMSGLLPRKLAQARAVPDEPTKEPTTESTEPQPAEHHAESPHAVEDNQLSSPPSSPTRQIMDEIARSPVKRAPPAPVQSIEETADATMSEGEKEPSASGEDSTVAEDQVSSGAEFMDEQMEDDTESAGEEPEGLIYETIETDIVQTEDYEHSTGEGQDNEGHGVSTDAEAPSDSAKEITEPHDTKQDTVETIESEQTAVTVAESEREDEPAGPSDSKDDSAPSTEIDTVMSDHEETPVEDSVEPTESTGKESVEGETAADNKEPSVEMNEKSESNNVEATTPLEDEESDLSSLSDEEMEEAEKLEALTPEALADTETTNLPSPSLSDATSPKFSAVADTLTLSMPEAVPSAVEEKKEPTSPLDSDTAFLRDFLSRADASKASKAANIARRESFTNRRDSDVVRQALASPRVALEDKDPNSPTGESPRRGRSKDAEESTSAKTPLSRKLDFNTEITADLSLEPQTAAAEKAETTEEPQNTRRSARARKTRIPSTPVPSAIPAPNRIPVRRADGTEPVVLKKTEAQEVATLTRANTRRNKGSALAAPIRLNKLKAEILKSSKSNKDPSSAMDPAPGAEIWLASKLRWDQQLVYFQEENKNPSLSEDELALKAGEDTRKSKATPSRVKRAKGLGTSNGTPGKGLLAPASLLPPEVQAEKEAHTAATATAAKPSSKKSASSKKSIPKPNAGTASNERATKASTPTDTQTQSKDAPAVSEAAKAPQISQLPTPAASKKSRLATPKKVKLPVPVGSTSTTPVPVQNMPPASAKENKAARPATAAAPKKLAAPKAGVAAAAAAAAAAGAAESGRRRIGRRA